MAKQIKSLAKDTAIYGLSSILGRFINWCLMPYYTFVLHNSADYGIVINLYAWTALLLVILTYGMETALFRFAGKDPENAGRVYGTSLAAVGTTSLLFAVFGVLFAKPVAVFLEHGNHPDFIAMLCAVVAMDAFSAIPFAWLRYKSRPVKFAAIKLLFVALNIVFNLFFLTVCPYLIKVNPALVSWFYQPEYGVGYVFVSNILATGIQTLFLIPHIKVKFCFDRAILKQMLHYALPLLVLGVAGIMNQSIDKIIYPYLLPDRLEADTQLGIYGACFKLAMIMMMFTQAFRYAYEPFIFAQHKNLQSHAAYADAMKFFIIFSLLIVMGITFYIDILQYSIASEYRSGLKVVPIVLCGYFFQGIFFNLSLWYKLTDKTKFGAIFSLAGLAIVLAINILFVPIAGYEASAWASVACYLVMTLLSYFFGQKYMPIKYDLRGIGFYAGMAALFLVTGFFINTGFKAADLLLKTLMIILFVFFIIKRDLPLRNIPVINRFASKKSK
jgi:O-antigen/teichoic acid export membrane protein